MGSKFTDIQKHVVSFGDYGLATAGQPLFNYVGTGRSARIVYNVVPGQIVAYTVANGVATIVDHTTLTAADLSSIFIGVGKAGKNGSTEDILHFGAEDISGCRPQEASTSSPRCGSAQVVDFYFDCTKCDETYTLMVKVDDNKTRSFIKAWNKTFSEFVGSIVTQCFTCDDCPQDHNCKEVACKLADALNGELDLRVGNQAYPDWKGSNLPRPYFATRLHENSFIYCLSPQTDETECVDCTYVAGIKGATINGTNYDFDGNLNPLDGTQTLKGQIDHIVAQLNAAFHTAYSNAELHVAPHGGSAYATGTYQDCCAVQIHVNTCDATFILYDVNNDQIDPQVSNNPFTEYGAYTTAPNCVDCGDVAIAARATLTLTGLPLDTETITVGARTYTFQDVLTNVDGNVKIGATAAATINNLVAAINLGGGAGTAYAAATTANTQVTAVDGPGDTVIFTAKAPGTGGNAYASTETLTNGSFGGATFAGGVAAAAGTTTTPACGIRVIAEAITGECGCLIDQPLNFYGRKVSIHAIGEGWRRKPYRIIDVQAMELPSGFGRMIQWLEYQNTPEGRGRRYSRSNKIQGFMLTPDNKSRVKNAVTARCDKNYCSYFLKTLHYKNKINDEFGDITINSHLHIPNTDSTTIAAWELLYNKIIELNPSCRVVTSTACSPNLGVCA